MSLSRVKAGAGSTERLNGLLVGVIGAALNGNGRHHRKDSDDHPHSTEHLGEGRVNGDHSAEDEREERPLLSSSSSSSFSSPSASSSPLSFLIAPTRPLHSCSRVLLLCLVLVVAFLAIVAFDAFDTASASTSLTTSLVVPQPFRFFPVDHTLPFTRSSPNPPSPTHSLTTPPPSPHPPPSPPPPNFPHPPSPPTPSLLLPSPHVTPTPSPPPSSPPTSGANLSSMECSR